MSTANPIQGIGKLCIDLIICGCVEVGVNGNTMHVTAEVDNAGYTAEFEITFCPMCGTKLTEEGK